MSENELNLINITADIVSAYVANNSVPAAELPGLIGSVHAALARLAAPAEVAAPELDKPSASAIRKSVTPDVLFSFLDGKPYKTLKRHLSTNGLTPAEYRTRYGLPNDYPMVAASYAAQRSALAKQSGLGRPGSRKGAAAARPAEAEPVRAAARSARKDPRKAA